MRTIRSIFRVDQRWFFTSLQFITVGGSLGFSYFI